MRRSTIRVIGGPEVSNCSPQQLAEPVHSPWAYGPCLEGQGSHGKL